MQTKRGESEPCTNAMALLRNETSTEVWVDRRVATKWSLWESWNSHLHSHQCQSLVYLDLCQLKFIFAAFLTVIRHEQILATIIVLELHIQQWMYTRYWYFIQHSNLLIITVTTVIDYCIAGKICKQKLSLWDKYKFGDNQYRSHAHNASQSLVVLAKTRQIFPL